MSRYTTPLGDRRERAVPCRRCSRRDPRTGQIVGAMTTALDRTCEACHRDECDCETDADGIPVCRPEASAESWEMS